MIIGRVVKEVMRVREAVGAMRVRKARDGTKGLASRDVNGLTRSGNSKCARQTERD